MFQVAFFRQQGVHRRNERAVRANEHVIAESHRTHVQNDQVEVGVAAFAEAGIAAVVKLQRPLQKCVLSAIGQQLCQNGFAFFGIGFQCVVVFHGKPVSQQPAGIQFGVAGVIEFSGKHFFFFRHDQIPPFCESALSC